MSYIPKNLNAERKDVENRTVLDTCTLTHSSLTSIICIFSTYVDFSSGFIFTSQIRLRTRDDTDEKGIWGCGKAQYPSQFSLISSDTTAVSACELLELL